ncbi:polyhydroxyalkanoate depolymerase [Bradyrhizobium diazoefficiens]
MPIGEFGGAPPLAAEGSPVLTTPMYWMYEMAHASLNPARAVTDATKFLFQNPLNPWARTEVGKSVAAACELFERTTRRYGKPEWGLNDTEVNGIRVPVEIRSVWEKPFCRLLYFDRKFTRPLRSPQPRVLIVAPMSGHYATLLRGTVEALLPAHDVYITDWADARMVPLSDGRFDLDDYIDYIIEMLHVLGGNTHVMAVCQPSVPVVAAVSIMEAQRDPFVPTSMTLMGGPIDTRRNPTAVNNLAQERGIDWFRNHVITKVPFPHPGMMRDVYPGFLQLNGFISMNLDRHMDAHKQLFAHLVKGDGDLVDKHREFYDEYLAVMDLSAEYYLQTVDTRVREARAAEGRDDPSWNPRRSLQGQACGVDDGRRRERRHLRSGSDRSNAHIVPLDPRSSPRSLRPEGRRPLRRVQRLAFQVGNRAEDSRLHGLRCESELVAGSRGRIERFRAKRDRSAQRKRVRSGIESHLRSITSERTSLSTRFSAFPSKIRVLPEVPTGLGSLQIRGI